MFYISFFNRPFIFLVLFLPWKGMKWNCELICARRLRPYRRESFHFNVSSLQQIIIHAFLWRTINASVNDPVIFMTSTISCEFLFPYCYMQIPKTGKFQGQYRWNLYTQSYNNISESSELSEYYVIEPRIFIVKRAFASECATAYYVRRLSLDWPPRYRCSQRNFEPRYLVRIMHVVLQKLFTVGSIAEQILSFLKVLTWVTHRPMWFIHLTFEIFEILVPTS